MRRGEVRATWARMKRKEGALVQSTLIVIMLKHATHTAKILRQKKR